jgi:predicted nucleic acid-binding protein
MISSSFPIDSNTILVADASVIINLNATGRARDIIQAQPGSLVVTESAFAELAAGAKKGHDDHAQLDALINIGAVRIVTLGESGDSIYASLVEGSAVRTLDDGEAATIGYAYEAGAIALIDERKARTICGRDFPHLSVASTIDFLMHELVAGALTARGQVEAIVNALRNARMRIPPHQIELVIKLIGEKNVAACDSIPKKVKAMGD